MIETISQMFLKWLLRTGAISKTDEELYGYAIYSFLFSMIPLGLVIIIGGVVGMLVEGILMVLPFILIRKFSGGFHLKTPKVCFVSSVLLLFMSLILIKAVIAKQYFLSFFAFASLSSLQIFLCSPQDSDTRKLSEKETTIFRRIARVMVCLFWLLSLLLFGLDLSRYAVSICTGVIITALLQLPCIFAHQTQYQ